MATKEVVWSDLAKLELENVLDFYFIRNGNTQYSLKLLGEIEDLIELLSVNHLLGRLCRNKVTRAVPVKHYLVFYEVTHLRIEIISFWDSRKNVQDLKVK